MAYKQGLLATRAVELVDSLPGEAVQHATLQVAAAVAGAAGLDLPGGAFGANALELLASVASGISEDICVMSRHSGQWQLVSAAVFFPSHWSPVAKVGLGLEAIHDPVPDYPRIANATEQAFDRIASATGIWERFNWTLTPDAELCHTSPAPSGVGVTEPPRSADDLWLRVERQTLAGLASDLVVFGIRTFLTPLPDLLASERVALGEAITGVSGELAEYRSWLGYREAVSRWVQG